MRLFHDFGFRMFRDMKSIAAAFEGKEGYVMNTGLLALLIILGIITGAIITRRCNEWLVGGALLGALIMFGPLNFIQEFCVSLQVGFSDTIWIILVCGLFGSLIALLTEAKGTFGFRRLVDKICNTPRKTMLTTFILGILIFVDDYLNVLSIGVCMKDNYDKQKQPREALAYLLDATGAPVCVLLPFSTWAAYFASIFIEEESVAALGYPTAIAAYMQAIPFMFYPIICLILVFLFACGIMPKLGDMKKAYKRVEETGKVYSDASKKYNLNDEEGAETDGNIWDFLVPLGVLVALTIITSDILMAVVASLLVCLVMYVPRGLVKFTDFFDLIIKGFADLLPILTLLVTTFTLGDITSQMGLTEFVIEVAQPFLAAGAFPAITFIIVAFLTFCSGSLWGMCAVVSPIVFPLGAAIGANPILIMAAVASGGAFGSHACFFTDATLLSSMSAGIENMDHTMSQLPYVIIGAVLSVIAFFICGYVML